MQNDLKALMEDHSEYALQITSGADFAVFLMALHVSPTLETPGNTNNSRNAMGN